MNIEMNVPSQVQRPRGAITMWVIYDHPDDHPDNFVLRPQFATRRAVDNELYGEVHESVGNGVVIHSPSIWLSKSARALRAILPPGCIPFAPMEGDDPKILEVWME